MQMAPQCLPIEGTTDEPTPKATLRTVYDALADHGYELPAPETYESEAHDPFKTGCGLTPEFMHDGTDVAEVIRTGVATPFSWTEAVEGAGTTDGSSHMTTVFVREQKTIEETVAHLCETGQIDLAVAKMEAFTADDVDAVEAVAYAVATYAKGWLAERIITADDRWTKGSQSNDEAGQDVYDRETGEYRQVKCVTKDKAVDGWLYYQWDMDGGLWVGDSHTDVNAAAIEGTDMPKTLTRRSAGNLKSVRESNRTGVRYTWW